MHVPASAHTHNKSRMNNMFIDLTTLASLAKERYPLKTMKLKSVIFGLSLGVAFYVNNFCIMC